jgi:hypothetical protein
MNLRRALGLYRRCLAIRGGEDTARVIVFNQRHRRRAHPSSVPYYDPPTIRAFRPSG